MDGIESREDKATRPYWNYVMKVLCTHHGQPIFLIWYMCVCVEPKGNIMIWHVWLNAEDFHVFSAFLLFVPFYSVQLAVHVYVWVEQLQITPQNKFDVDRVGVNVVGFIICFVSRIANRLESPPTIASNSFQIVIFAIKAVWWHNMMLWLLDVDAIHIHF